jgi:2-polyprenyl-6-methoxyphenol hydroxylase-like FAD-dependent oxidoreductase
MVTTRRGTDGIPRRPMRHAIVLGGSVAGLLAARVLADRFERVTLVERDPIAGDGEATPRRGVPQGAHVHALLARGLGIVEGLFPGLSGGLCAAGAALICGGRELRWHHAGGWRVSEDRELIFLSMTRPLLERGIAARVRGLPNVALRGGLRALGLAGDRGRVTGLRVAVEGGAVEEIAADLVVDASGRGSVLPRWLGEIGCEAPRSELLTVPVGYASRFFRAPERRPAWRALLASGAPARRGGVMFPVEGDRFLLTLTGFFDEPMPQNHDAFLAYAASLPVPDIHAAIRDLEPVSEIRHFRFAGSLRRRYEALGRYPAGLIALGDAVCSFNPVYGQGMTVAAMEAEALDAALARAAGAGGLDADFPRRWFRDIAAPIVDGAWGGVRIEDLRFPEMAARRPLGLRPIQWYMGRVQRATHRSPAVTDRFYRVMNFLEPPTSLFRPGIVAEALFGGLRGLGAARVHAAGVPAVAAQPGAARV